MKRKYLIITALLAIFITNLKAQKLSTSWSTDAVLDVPESVLYYPYGDYLLVSNIVGQPAQPDGSGFISKLSTDGRVIQLKWVTGLNAPKGMAATKTKLYVSDINALIIIDIKSGTIEKRIVAKEAKFLNDVTRTPQGDIYVSDSGNSRIYKLVNNKLINWKNGNHLQGVNGLFAEDQFLLVGTKNQMLKYDLTTEKYSVFIDHTCSIDGIEADGKGGYFFSAWRGELYHWSPNTPLVQLLNTADKKKNCADIGYDPKRNHILVPTFRDNRVVAYTFQP